MTDKMPLGVSGLGAPSTTLVDFDPHDAKIAFLGVFINNDTLFKALSPDLAARVISEFARRPAVKKRDDAGLTRLTARELDVFKLLVSGHRNDEIAKTLFVAENTVKTHVQRLYDKLGIRDRVRVVIYAYEHGLVDAGQAGLGL